MPNIAVSIKDGSDLETVKQSMLDRINRDVNEYISSYYDAGTQQSFTGLYSKRDTPDALRDYIDPVWAWITGIMTYYYARKSAILAADNVLDCREIDWDFEAFTASKPDVSLQSILAMATE